MQRIIANPLSIWAKAVRIDGEKILAVAEVEGPASALTLVENLGLERYHLYHAIRAALLRRLGRTVEAALAYEVAITRTENETEHNQCSRQALTWD